MTVRRLGKVLLLVAAAFVQGGCTWALVGYSVGLERLSWDGVVVPTDSIVAADSVVYVDSAFVFSWSEQIGLCVRLTNRLDRPMIVHWGDAQFIDSAGQRQAIVVPGGPVMPRYRPWGKKSTADQTLAPGETLLQFIIPAKAVRQAHSWSACGWDLEAWVEPLSPVVGSGRRSKVELEATKEVHRRFGVITPISIDGRIRLYQFDLIVTGFRLGGADL